MADPKKPTNPTAQPNAPALTDSDLKKLGTELTHLSIGSSSGSGESEVLNPEMQALLDDFGDSPAASQLSLEQYRRLERDSKVAACLQIRSSAVVNRDSVIVPGGGEEIDLKATEFVREQLLANDGRSGLLDKFASPMLAQGLLLGFSVAEILWEKGTNGMITIADVRPRDIEHFVFRRPPKPAKGAFTHFGHHLYFEGGGKASQKPLPDRRFFAFTFGSRVGNPYGLGLGLKLWWYTYFKREAHRRWQDYADKFADPVPYVTVDQAELKVQKKGITDAEIEEFMKEGDKFAKRLRRGTTAGLPHFMSPQFLEPSRSGTIQVYKDLIDTHDEAISQIILGNINAGASQGLSGAPAGNDETIRFELARADSEQFHGQLNASIVRWLVELNFPGAKPPQVWRDFSQQEPLSDRAQRDSTLLQLGYRLSPEAVARLYGPDYIDTEAEDDSAQSPLAAWMASRNSDNDTDGSLDASGGGDKPADDAPTDDAPTDEPPTDEPPTDEPPQDEAPADEAGAGDSPAFFAEPEDLEGFSIDELAELSNLDRSLLYAEYEAGAIDALEFGVSPRDAGMRRVRRFVGGATQEPV